MKSKLHSTTNSGRIYLPNCNSEKCREKSGSQLKWMNVSSSLTWLNLASYLSTFSPEGTSLILDSQFSNSILFPAKFSSLTQNRFLLPILASRKIYSVFYFAFEKASTPTLVSPSFKKKIIPGFCSVFEKLFYFTKRSSIRKKKSRFNFYFAFVKKHAIVSPNKILSETKFILIFTSHFENIYSNS